MFPQSQRRSFRKGLQQKCPFLVLLRCAQLLKFTFSSAGDECGIRRKYSKEKLYHSGELSFEASAVSPETQAGVCHKENLFTIHLVVAIVQFLWIVFFGHALEISVAERRPADFL